MASVAMLIGGAIVNGLAFSGTNFLFSKFGHAADNHYEALEKLQAAQDAYEKKRLATLDFINQRLSDQRHANQTYSDVDEAMREYYRITGQKLYLPSKPKASDFYQMSENKKMQEILFIILGTATVYYIATKV